MSKGTFVDVEDVMIDDVSEADERLLPKDVHIIINTEEDLWKLDTKNCPFVIIRIDNGLSQDYIYGRVTAKNEFSVFTSYSFSINVYMLQNFNTYRRHNDAMVLAEKIRIHLLNKGGHNCVAYYENLNVRNNPFSNTSGRISRVTVDGTVFVKTVIFNKESE